MELFQFIEEIAFVVQQGQLHLERRGFNLLLLVHFYRRIALKLADHTEYLEPKLVMMMLCLIHQV